MNMRLLYKRSRVIWEHFGGQKAGFPGLYSFQRKQNFIGPGKVEKRYQVQSKNSAATSHVMNLRKRLSGKRR